ncbi:hypothetical protein [Eudoraea sp.]|uniref:hypothetical protein n=1 Tax=Eudoraea sp. TaxID=1979955 RepID=UPI003C71ED8B
MKRLGYLVLVVLLGCSSSDMVSSWKNPEIVIFDAQKVLLVGMTSNKDIQDDFETKMKKEFTERGVESMRSLDVFDIGFTDNTRTEEELDEVEQTLLDRDFDAILFTKILGSESRQTFRKSMANLDNYYGDFKDDYISHQELYFDPEPYQKQTVYIAESSLYCICVGKERQLIWRGIIEITEPKKVKNAIDDYVRIVVLNMEEQDLIFYEN